LPVLFLAFWVMINARITLEVVVLGIIISAAMSLFTYRYLGVSFGSEKRIWTKAAHIFIYLFVLLKEIINANIQMIKIVLQPKIKIKPQIIYFKSPFHTNFAEVMLTYSIILTPGTIVFHLDDGVFGVHAIDSELGVGINDSDFVHRLKTIEGESADVSLR